MQKQSEEKTSHSAAKISIKILLLILILPFVIPGFLLGWSMVAQSWMERMGYAKPTYSKNAVCVVVDDVSIYEKKLTSSIVESYGRISIQDCKEEDQMTDVGDGPHKGKVRWYICWGIDCDEAWEYAFMPKQKNTSVSDVIAFGFAAFFIALFIVLPIGLAIRLIIGIFSSEIRKRIRARPFLHILGFIFFLIIISPVLFIEWIQLPADNDVAEHFYKNKSEFAKLAEMLSDDNQIQYISESLVSPWGLIEGERFGQYKDLMDQTELLCIRSNAGQPQEITFLREDCYATSKFVKGYVYAISEPHTPKASLDGDYKDLPPRSRMYKRIEKNWYIYLEHQKTDK